MVSFITHTEGWQMDLARLEVLQQVWDNVKNMEKHPYAENDSVVWMASSSGRFTSTSAWLSSRVVSDEVPWSEVVWCYKHIPKHSSVTWRAISPRFPTQSRLCKLKILNTS